MVSDVYNGARVDKSRRETCCPKCFSLSQAATNWSLSDILAPAAAGAQKKSRSRLLTNGLPVNCWDWPVCWLWPSERRCHS